MNKIHQAHDRLSKALENPATTRAQLQAAGNALCLALNAVPGYVIIAAEDARAVRSHLDVGHPVGKRAYDQLGWLLAGANSRRLPNPIRRLRRALRNALETIKCLDPDYDTRESYVEGMATLKNRGRK